MIAARERARPRTLHLLLWAILALALAVQVVRIRMAEGAVRERHGKIASQIRPQNGWGRALNAERLLEQGNVGRAISESLAALRQTPLAVVALRTLALARERRDGAGAGESAWQAAASMGWRDKETQLWGVLRALSNGEAPILAMRADALLRNGDPEGRLSSMIRAFMREPAVRAAFVERLALNPPWRRHFLTYPLSPRGEELDGLVATLHELTQSKAPPTRFETRTAIEGLIARRRFSDAAALHRAVTGRTPTLPIDDGGFEQGDSFYRIGSTPFDWISRTLSHSSAALDASEGRSMTVTTSGRAAQPALRRYVLLDPGSYRLRYSMRGEPQSPARIGVRVSCAPDNEPIAESARAPLANRDWQVRQLEFQTGPDCPVVALWVGGLGAEASDAQFDNFVLERTDRTAQPSR